jgi:hypothetical protein
VRHPVHTLLPSAPILYYKDFGPPRRAPNMYYRKNGQQKAPLLSKGNPAQFTFYNLRAVSPTIAHRPRRENAREYTKYSLRFSLSGSVHTGLRSNTQNYAVLP